MNRRQFLGLSSTLALGMTITENALPNTNPSSEDDYASKARKLARYVVDSNEEATGATGTYHQLTAEIDGLAQTVRVYHYDSPDQIDYMSFFLETNRPNNQSGYFALALHDMKLGGICTHSGHRDSAGKDTHWDGQDAKRFQSLYEQTIDRLVSFYNL